MTRVSIARKRREQQHCAAELGHDLSAAPAHLVPAQQRRARAGTGRRRAPSGRASRRGGRSGHATRAPSGRWPRSWRSRPGRSRRTPSASPGTRSSRHRRPGRRRTTRRSWRRRWRAPSSVPSSRGRRPRAARATWRRGSPRRGPAPHGRCRAWRCCRAAPHQSDAPVKTTSPITKSRRRPNRSAIEPDVRTTAASATRVGVHDPLEAGDPGVEAGRDLRQRRVDDGDVEHEHGRRETHDGESSATAEHGNPFRCRKRSHRGQSGRGPGAAHWWHLASGGTADHTSKA